MTQSTLTAEQLFRGLGNPMEAVIVPSQAAKEKRNASPIDAYVDGYQEARNGKPMEAPECFSPAARAEWCVGWKHGREELGT